jgi:hypothetical protein
MLTIKRCAIAATTAAAIALTSFSATPASAGTRHGNAVAAAAIAGVFGTVAALIAADAARDRYARYYGPPPVVYPPYAYGAAPLYRGHHGGPRWHGWHRRHWHR